MGIPKQKSQHQLQSEVDAFNQKHKVGDKVMLRIDSDGVKEVTIKHPATIAGGHSAVGWFEEISGYYLLDRVQK
jgi:hypothetical protein